MPYIIVNGLQRICFVKTLLISLLRFQGREKNKKKVTIILSLNSTTLQVKTIGKIKQECWACTVIWMLIAFLVTIPLFAETQGTRRTIGAIWVDSPPVIDGALTDTVWQQAEIATDFFRAKEGITYPAELNTEVMVLYDEEMLYIGVRCEEPDMKSLRETMTRRDSFVWQNDCIEVMLDTYHDQRNCYIFAINTLGTQADERVGNESVFDMSWDAKWEAKVKKNPNDWTAEFAIPFREVRFDRRNTTWGVNFWRVRPINGQSHSWAKTAFFSRVSEFGDLTGLNLEKIKTEQKIGILPYGSYRAIANRSNDLAGGVDLMLPLSTHLTSNVTLNPDFSQLESDPTQINISSDRELFLPERRPFFKEGADLFQLPLDLFYTRRVQEIDLGAKTTGKIGNSNFAVINTYGKMIDRYDADQKKQVNLLAGRVNRDIGERTVIGAMGVHKHQSDRDVALLSLNGRFGLHRDWTAASQYAIDLVDGEMHWAYHTATEWIHEGWLGEVQLEEIQDGFRPNEMGLEEEAFRRARARLRYRYEFPETHFVESLWIDTRHFHQTNAQRLLRERLSESRFYIDIGEFSVFTSGGSGVLREVGQLFDTRYIRSDIDYQAPWGQLGIVNRFGTRRNEFNRFTSFSGGVNLFDKLTIDLDLENFFWRAHRNTLIFRLRGNYQFTQKIGWRIFVERVDERMQDEISYSFNSIFDYEFTPESHFYFVVVDSLPGERAVFTKLAYLFESSFPNFGQFN